MTDITKTCPKCKRTLATDAFRSSRQTKDGLHGWCRDCTRAAGRAYAAAHQQKCYETLKAWIAAKPERWKQGRREYYLANKEKVAADNQAWRAANPEKVKESGRRSDRKRLPQKLAAANVRRRANPEAYRAKQKAFYKANTEIVKAWVHSYRARKRAAEGSYTPADIERIAKQQKNRCAYCRKDITAAPVIDHIKSLSKGGSNHPNNLQLVCLPCNSSKRDKDAIAFAQQLGRLL